MRITKRAEEWSKQGHTSVGPRTYMHTDGRHFYVGGRYDGMEGCTKEVQWREEQSEREDRSIVGVQRGSGRECKPLSRAHRTK